MAGLSNIFLGYFLGTVPDAFLIDLKDIDNSEFYLVEIELSTDDFFKFSW